MKQTIDSIELKNCVGGADDVYAPSRPEPGIDPSPGTGPGPSRPDISGSIKIYLQTHDPKGLGDYVQGLLS